MGSDLAIQMGLLGVTSLLFAGGFLLGLQHMRRTAQTAGAPAGIPRLPHEASMGSAARVAVAVGILLGVILFAWRAISAGTVTLALRNPLDAFLVLGMLLAITVAWFRWTRHLRSLSFFLLPMIVIVLLLGLILAAIHPSESTGTAPYLKPWTQLHVITIVGGTVCFALACVGAAVYLLADRQLKRKGLDASHRWIGLPPLASIEKFNRWMIYAGFPLLTIATGAGILCIMETPSTAAGSGALKIAVGTLAWLVYAVLMHVPLNPRFRGRSSAWLMIAGFVLYMAAYAAARWS